MKHIRKLFSFSNAVAFVALFVALGGTVYAAGKISGSQIKPNSLPGNRVKAGTITAKQVKAGSLTGQQVVGKSLTGVSASSLATVQYVSVNVNVPDDGFATGTSVCPAGTKVIGGGALLSNREDDEVFESGPSADRNGWTASSFSEPALPRPGTMTVTAICTAVVSTTG